MSLLGSIIDTVKDSFNIGGIAGSTVARQVAASDPRCKKEGLNDKGIERVARIRGAMNAAILGLNTLTALKIAELQHSLAKDYAKLAENYRNHYFDRYHPIEKELIDEALQEPEYVRDKDEFIKGQMLITAKMPFVGKLEKALSCTGRYCTGQRQAITNDILIEQAMTESLVCGLAHRHMDDEELIRNTRRWERRSNVIKLGSNIPTEAVSYASMATGIFGSLGEQASKGAMGATWFLGQGERRDTVYPERRMPLTFLNYTPNIPDPQKVEPYKIPSITLPNIPTGEPVRAEIKLLG